MESILKNPDSGRGVPVDQSVAQPGDLVFFGGLSHVGVCANVGCTETLSNSSSQARFAAYNIVPAQGSRFSHVN
jgi:cell wall-associated NlpC family hydrolase